MSIIAGKEKFWNSLLTGGFVAAASVIVRAGASYFEIIDPPSREAIASALDGVVVALAAAASAYLTTNSAPTNISVPAEAVPVPTPEPETIILNEGNRV